MIRRVLVSASVAGVVAVLAMSGSSDSRVAVNAAEPEAVTTTTTVAPAPSTTATTAARPVYVAPTTTLPPAPPPDPVYGAGSYVVGQTLAPGAYTVSAVCTFELPAENTPNRGVYAWATTYSNVAPGAVISIPAEAAGLTVVAWAGCQFT